MRISDWSSDVCSSDLLIWPYAVATAVAGVLWLFLFSPSVGILAVFLADNGIAWNPRLDGDDAMILVVLASVWKQISYNFLFFQIGRATCREGVCQYV